VNTKGPAVAEKTRYLHMLQLTRKKAQKFSICHFVNVHISLHSFY